MKHARLFLHIVVLIVVWVGIAAAGDHKRVVVQVGDDPTGDMCGGYGTMTEEVPKETGTVSVYDGPGESFKVIDQIPKGHWVSMCDEHGPWEGIVYTFDKEIDCEVGTPSENRHAYNGKCRSGWILRKHIGEFAG